MVCIGNLIAPVGQQLYLVHCIQLAVIEILYKKITVEEDEFDGDDDDERDDGLQDGERDELMYIAFDQQTVKTMIREQYFEIIRQVRKVVKLFRMTVNSEKIAIYTNLQLVLDMVTRWSSLFDMIDRFIKLYDPIKKALFDINSSDLLSNFPIQSLKELHSA